jgi:hypothetical protein
MSAVWGSTFSLRRSVRRVFSTPISLPSSHSAAAETGAEIVENSEIEVKVSGETSSEASKQVAVNDSKSKPISVEDSKDEQESSKISKSDFKPISVEDSTGRVFTCDAFVCSSAYYTPPVRPPATSAATGTKC